MRAHLVLCTEFSHSFLGYAEDPNQTETRIALQLFTYRCHYSADSACIIHNANNARPT